MNLPLLQIGVALQPILWGWLFNKDLRIKPNMAQVMLIIAAMGIWLSGFSSGFYTNTLLVFYALAVAYTVGAYASRPGLQPICMGFLIVYLNSYFWEFPIHVADLFSGNVGVVAVQSIHLLAVPIILAAGVKLPARWWYTSLYLWALVLFLTYLRMEHLLPAPWNMVSLYGSRVAGLLVLIYLVRFPGQRENSLISQIQDKVTQWRSSG